MKLAFTLPHKMAYETDVKAFQYKILNSILYTNTKLFKIGCSEHGKCTFCNNKSETLHHLFFNCPHLNLFWKHLEKYYFNLAKQLKVLSLQEIIIGITALSYPLLNYFILIGKVHIWDCRRKHVWPYIEGFILKINTIYKMEKYIATKNNDLETFYKKWTGNFPL